MGNIQGEAEALQQDPKRRKAQDFAGYWVPGGVGYNHKKPKAAPVRAYSVYQCCASHVLRGTMCCTELHTPTLALI